MVGDGKVAQDVSIDDPGRLTQRRVGRVGGEDCITVIFFTVCRNEPDKSLGIHDAEKRKEDMDGEKTHLDWLSQRGELLIL